MDLLMPVKSKVVWPALGAVVLASAAGIAVRNSSGAAHADAPSPTPVVDVVPVAERLLVQWHDYSGRLEAVDEAEVRPLVSGTIVAVHFQDGEMVRKGQPLFTIDQRPYRAEVERAQGQLAAARSAATFAQSDFARARDLVGQDGIAKRDYEDRERASRTAAANVQIASAALDAARLNLGYATVVAPIAGRVSRAELKVGNVVTAGGNAPLLTRIVSASPIYAAFDADEQSYLGFMHGSKALDVELGLAGEQGFERKGHIASLDNRLDVRSGTIRTRAIFDNADGALVPGLYARIRVSTGAARPTLLVDQRAVGTDQDKKFVLVVGADDRVVYRQVTLGGDRGGYRIVTAGLAAADRAIVGGAGAVKPGDRVTTHRVEGAAL
jgi:multidrug efflux system membrane fusion protein